MSSSGRTGAIAVALAAIILAAFVIGVWSGNTDNQYGHPYTEQSQQAYSYTDKEAAELGIVGSGSRTYQEICANPHSHEDGDLCQQWRAANASRDTSRFTFWQFNLGVLGTVGVGVTVFYAIRTYRLSITTSKAELRAYINVRTGGVFEFSETRFAAGINFENDGQTPAYAVRSVTLGFIVNTPINENDTAFVLARVAEADMGNRTNTVTRGRGHSTSCDFEPTGDFLQARTRVVDGTMQVAVAGKIVYRDAFGDTHTTNFFHYYPPGLWEPDSGMYHHQGNDSD